MLRRGSSQVVELRLGVQHEAFATGDLESYHAVRGVHRDHLAVEAQPRAQVWRAVAAFTRAYVQVEAQGFDMLEA